MSKTTKRILIMLACVVVLTAVLAFGFYLHVQKLIAAAPRPGAQVVSATEVRSLEWQPLLSAVGTVTAVRGVDVTTEIAGLVRSINFKSGDEVKAGAVLLQLNADSDIAALQSLQAAAELSATTLERDRQQFEAEAISKAQLDNDTADLKSRRALAAQQQALIAKKTIRAPFAGRLGITTVQPGQYLNPGDRIVTLQTIDPIYVDFYLPQKQLGGLKLGQVVNLTTDGFPGQVFPGKITAINPKVDTTTRNILVEATLPNSKRLLLPGMFANATVDVGDKQRYLTLPQTAVTYNPTARPSSSSARRRPRAARRAARRRPRPPPRRPRRGGLAVRQVFVTTGETRGDQVAILKGLEAGQQVVTSGQVKLKNGTPVVVDNTVQPGNDPNPTPQEK